MGNKLRTLALEPGRIDPMIGATIFRRYDRDGDGVLSLKECQDLVHAVCKAQGRKDSADELKRFLHNFARPETPDRVLWRDFVSGEHGPPSPLAGAPPLDQMPRPQQVLAQQKQPPPPTPPPQSPDHPQVQPQLQQKQSKAASADRRSQPALKRQPTHPPVLNHQHHQLLPLDPAAAGGAPLLSPAGLPVPVVATKPKPAAHAQPPVFPYHYPQLQQQHHQQQQQQHPPYQPQPYHMPQFQPYQPQQYQPHQYHYQQPQLQPQQLVSPTPTPYDSLTNPMALQKQLQQALPSSTGMREGRRTLVRKVSSTPNLLALEASSPAPATPRRMPRLAKDDADLSDHETAGSDEPMYLPAGKTRVRPQQQQQTIPGELRMGATALQGTLAGKTKPPSGDSAARRLRRQQQQQLQLQLQQPGIMPGAPDLMSPQRTVPPGVLGVVRGPPVMIGTTPTPSASQEPGRPSGVDPERLKRNKATVVGGPVGRTSAAALGAAGEARRQRKALGGHAPAPNLPQQASMVPHKAGKRRQVVAAAAQPVAAHRAGLPFRQIPPAAAFGLHLHQEFSRWDQDHSDTDRISPYDIVWGAKIGEGTYGEVYRGTLWGQDVAIKRLKYEALPLNHVDILADFMNEVKVLRSVRHPNIVSYLGASYEPPELLIIMELMENGSLWKLMQKKFATGKRFTRWKVIEICADICRGINWLHHKGIVHRDLKPGNVLVSKHQQMQIADFGLAGKLRGNRAQDQFLHGVAGTGQYMAPEVRSNLKYDTKADVYSFGVILAELCCGRNCYDEDPQHQQQLQAAMAAAAAAALKKPGSKRGTQVPLMRLPADLWPPLAQLIRDCWSFDPERRPSMEEILDRLHKMRQDLGSEGKDLMDEMTPAMVQVFRALRRRLREFETDLQQARSKIVSLEDDLAMEKKQAAFFQRALVELQVAAALQSSSSDDGSSSRKLGEDGSETMSTHDTASEPLLEEELCEYASHQGPMDEDELASGVASASPPGSMVRGIDEEEEEEEEEEGEDDDHWHRTPVGLSPSMSQESLCELSREDCSQIGSLQKQVDGESVRPDGPPSTDLDVETPARPPASMLSVILPAAVTPGMQPLTQRELAVCAWVSARLGEELPRDPLQLDVFLRDGSQLCRLLNALVPGTVTEIVREDDGNGEDACVINANRFVTGAIQRFGLRPHELFMPVDLQQPGRGGMSQVLLCLEHLAERWQQQQQQQQQLQAQPGGSKTPRMHHTPVQSPQLQSPPRPFLSLVPRAEPVSPRPEPRRLGDR